MLKGIVVSLNLGFLYLLSLILANGVNVTLDCPEQMDNPGNMTVTINFTKGELGGFAKFQQRFPATAKVSMIDSANARVEYIQGQLKLIWMNNLPAEDFSISYNVSIDDPNVKEMKIGGKFTYLTPDNQRSTFDLPNKLITVGELPQIVVKEKPKPEASFERMITKESGDTYLMTILITKKNLNEFAKVEDFLPAGASATVVEQGGGVFTQIDKKVKFVWMNIPKAEELEISYRVDLGTSGDKDPQNINGKFSYVFDGATRELIIPGKKNQPGTESPQETNVIADAGDSPFDNSSSEQLGTSLNTSTPKETNVDQVKTKPSTSQIGSNQSTTPKPSSTAKPTRGGATGTTPKSTGNQPTFSSPNTTNKLNGTTKPKPVVKQAPKQTVTKPTLPKPQTGVFYRVQLLAGHNRIDGSYMKNHHNYVSTFYLENHAGWNKATTGHYPEYRLARDGRNQLRSSTHRFPGPFVVAYNSGERITVQEALMITGQRWVP